MATSDKMRKLIKRLRGQLASVPFFHFFAKLEQIETFVSAQIFINVRLFYLPAVVSELELFLMDFWGHQKDDFEIE